MAESEKLDGIAFGGKEWKALIDFCVDKKNGDVRNYLRHPILDAHGYLHFTDSFIIVRRKVDVLTVQPPYNESNFVTYLDNDPFDKVLVKDQFFLTKDDLYKNGKQDSRWEHTAISGRTVDLWSLVENAKNHAGKLEGGVLERANNNFGIGHKAKILKRIVALTDALYCDVRLLTSTTAEIQDEKSASCYYIDFVGTPYDGCFMPVRLV